LFTGLILGLGEVSALNKKNGGASLVIKSVEISGDAGIGDSISINGTCLTVVEIKGQTLAFDLSDETLRSTNLGRLKVTDRVNLEPSLRPNTKMGGHFVTGHIDGVGKIVSRTPEGDMFKIVIGVEQRIAGYLVEKGSVAVDGISLTVVDVFSDSFSLVIIPHTAKLTTLGFKTVGDTINIEVDILGKYVEKFLGKRKDAGLMETLTREGFA
jgi:riboflavin synthase